MGFSSAQPSALRAHLLRSPRESPRGGACGLLAAEARPVGRQSRTPPRGGFHNNVPRRSRGRSRPHLEEPVVLLRAVGASCAPMSSTAVWPPARRIPACGGLSAQPAMLPILPDESFASRRAVGEADMVEVSQGFLGEGKEFGEEAFFSAYFELLERVSSTANLANEAEARANRPIFGDHCP